MAKASPLQGNCENDARGASHNRNKRALPTNIDSAPFLSPCLHIKHLLKEKDLSLTQQISLTGHLGWGTLSGNRRTLA